MKVCSESMCKQQHVLGVQIKNKPLAVYVSVLLSHWIDIFDRLMMLYPMRTILGYIAHHHRYPIVLAGDINGFKGRHLDAQIRKVLTNSYHCTTPQFKKAEIPTDDPDPRITLTRAKLAILNKVKAVQPVYKTFSLATAITLSRAATAPALCYFALNGMHSYALACMAYVAVSDVLDKYVATKTKQASPMNAVLDSIADKLVVITSTISMYNVGLIPIYVCKTFVFKDIVILGSAAAIRYNGFDERPSLKEFLDFNKSPTLGFKPKIIERITRGLEYSVLILPLVVSIEVLNNEYFMPTLIYQLAVSFMCCLSIGTRLIQLGDNRFESRLSRA